MAVWHKAAEDIPVNVRRTMVDWDGQRFVFQCEQFTKSYDPTLAQWNWFKNGQQALIDTFPNVTGLVFPDCDAGKHPNPGHFE